ncbi:outer membrane protein [Paracoccus sediminis]|nr:outer membrane beta-barrel protein [Paracoccus sediminis]SNR33909.1 outer membrane immunogenic protein [Paracoccus sediminis]
MRPTRFAALCALGVLTASRALAGGYAAPVSDPVAVAPVAAADPVDDWTGGYAGGSLGYAFGGNDSVGFDLYNNGDLIGRDDALGRADIKGPTVAFQAGYRWQRGNWVFGPELWIEGGSVDATDTLGADPGARIESAVNYLVGVQAKTGYVVTPRTLVYAAAGAVYGDLDYSLSDAAGTETVTYDTTGYSLGLGVERKVRDNLSLFAEWQYRNLGETDIEAGDEADSVLTRATPEHQDLRLGVNFSF